jgi:hypothetical protein
MPTVKTGYWIRVKNGQVIAVWDYEPPGSKKGSEAGWREAVEIFPDVTENREIMTTHVIDIDKSPAEIVWSKRELTVGERKDNLIRRANAEFQEIVDEQMRIEMDDTDASVDLGIVSAAKATKDARIAEINAATTHEEVDAL